MQITLHSFLEMNTVTPKNLKLLSSGLLVSALACTASAALYTENFDVDNSANWQFFSSIAGDVNGNNSGGEADFFFDYSTVGIPSAPNSGGTTRGMKLEANVPGTGIFSGMSASPLGQNFTGDYTLRFDMWMNTVGPFPGGGSGSTQLSMAGIGGGPAVNWFGSSVPGVTVGATGDGGSGNDYRIYTAAGAPVAETSGAYAAGNVLGVTNNTHPYYSGFQGTVPAAQLALFPGQTGTPAVGTQSFAWRRWEVSKVGDVVSWSIDGLAIASVTKANLNGNIYFSQSDVNGSSSADPNARALLFGLIDNVSVEAVPEPATMTVLAGAAALAALKRRKK